MSKTAEQKKQSKDAVDEEEIYPTPNIEFDLVRDQLEESIRELPNLKRAEYFADKEKRER